MKQKNLSPLLLPIIALILELLPYGVALHSAHPLQDGTLYHSRLTYSYFSLIPYGYANVGPFFTAILTCVVLLLLVIFCITRKTVFLKISLCLTGAAAITSVLPLGLDLRFYSVLGAAITVVLLAAFLYMLWIVIKKRYRS